MNIDPHNIRDAVLKKIQSGQAKMRPHWRFVARAILILLLLILTMFIILYLTSLIHFMLRRGGAWFAPSFGWRGLRIFFLSFPWLIGAVSLFFLLALELILRRYAFAYRRPLIYSLGAVLVLLLMGGAILARMRFQEKLFLRAEENRLPFGGHMYQEFGRRRFAHVHAGTISELRDNGFTLTNRSGEILTIILEPEARPARGMNISAGADVVVLGDREDHTIRAFGLRQHPDRPYGLRPRRRMRIR